MYTVLVSVGRHSNVVITPSWLNPRGFLEYYAGLFTRKALSNRYCKVVTHAQSDLIYLTFDLPMDQAHISTPIWLIINVRLEGKADWGIYWLL